MFSALLFPARIVEKIRNFRKNSVNPPPPFFVTVRRAIGRVKIREIKNKNIFEFEMLKHLYEDVRNTWNEFCIYLSI